MISFLLQLFHEQFKLSKIDFLWTTQFYINRYSRLCLHGVWYVVIFVDHFQFYTFKNVSTILTKIDFNSTGHNDWCNAHDRNGIKSLVFSFFFFF